MEKLSYTEEKDFIPLNKLLLEDSEEIKKIKSIYQREMEYVQFLGPIESFFAYYYYYDCPKLRDADVARAIKNVRTNWNKDLDFFKNIFEKEPMGVISFTLQNVKRKITRHELFLVLGYILWCIDNRRWIGDSRAYLNWICNFFHLFNKEEKRRFDKVYDQLGKKFGKSEEEIKIMKNEKVDFEFPATEIALNKLDSEKFAAYESQENDEMDEEELEEYAEGEKSIWQEGSFIQSISLNEVKKRMKTFHKRHDEDMNFRCRKCGKKISAHNRDWHAGLCDSCFDKR